MAVPMLDVPDLDLGAGAAQPSSVDTEVEYLDLDHDGLPDAVRVTEIHRHKVGLDDDAEVVHTVVRLATGIGDDGVATETTTTESLEVHVGPGDRTAGPAAGLGPVVA